jgi:hypothetical protein
LRSDGEEVKNRRAKKFISTIFDRQVVIVFNKFHYSEFRMFTKSRVALVVTFFAGVIFSSISGGPKEALAQSRITLTSVYNQVLGIINGTITVGKADEAAFATNSESLGGSPSSDFATAADLSALAANLSALESQMSALQTMVNNLNANSPYSRTYNVSTATTELVKDKYGNAIPLNFTGLFFAGVTTTTSSASSYWMIRRRFDGQVHLQRIADFGSTTSNTPELYVDGSNNIRLRLYNHTTVYQVNTQLTQLVPAG